MDDREALTRLRSLVYRGDGLGLVRVLSEEPWPADSLHLIGEGLLAAVSDGVDGAPELARTCIDALGERAGSLGEARLESALPGSVPESACVGSRSPSLISLTVSYLYAQWDRLWPQSSPMRIGGRYPPRTCFRP